MNKQANRDTPLKSCLLLGFAVAMLTGCDSSVDSAKQGSDSSAGSSISLQVTDAAGYDEAVASQRGKVVLVDFWATWCATCIEQFPHTVALFEQYRDRGLAVFSVSLDQPKAEPQVRTFLENNRASFTNLLSSYKNGVAAIEAFGLPGPVPCYRVYDRTGKLRHEFGVDPRAERQFTIEDIKAAVTELL